MEFIFLGFDLWVVMVGYMKGEGILVRGSIGN